MSELTKEWLQNMITGIESVIDDKSFVCDEIVFKIGEVKNILTAFKVTLASLEAEAPSLPGGFTIKEAKELHKNLVKSHVSKALSGEKMKKENRDADLRWIHDVIVRAAWFVKASLEQNTLTGNSPVTPDSWISCSERMPDSKTAVLVAREFDRKGDWRMKWATYIPGHPDANDGWIIPGASWKPSHWMPLPEPPQEVSQ
ncbi:DUF551 domain-containing protein [Escherichia coli]|nr:DUF551 domain-containing protein [Escherichia coli]EGP3292741.1 DUF551 domain-containing protein [Escherichia coli]EKP3526573.1 DUF551 domain-containing protein [Escherichia coli]